MNILITGACGFVGFSIANKLLKSKNSEFTVLIMLILIIQKKVKK